MMAESSFTQAQIDAFEAALATRQGARSITVGDQTVTFGSYEECLAFLAHMKRSLVTNTAPRTRYAAFTKGM
jgi:hypothetical protein